MSIEIAAKIIEILGESTTFNALPDLRHAHYVDVVVRISGRDVHYEADWIKYVQMALRPADPSTVGSGDSVDSGPDPQGAADPRGAPREPA